VKYGRSFRHYAGGASDWWPPPETVESLRQFLRERILPAMQGAYTGYADDLARHEFLRDAIVELERRITITESNS